MPTTSAKYALRTVRDVLCYLGLAGAIATCAQPSDELAPTEARSVAVQRRALTAAMPVYGEVFRVAHTATGAVDLTNFQVQVKIDTMAEIAANRMRSDCGDIRVEAGDGCSAGTAVDFWVADGTCNTTETNVWLGLPSLLTGSITSFVIHWGDPSATSLSNGFAVFPIFFDDFNGASLDTSKWETYGANKLSQASGILTNNGGASALWTKNRVMAADQTVFGVRTNAQSAGGADIEYGAATLISPSGGAIHWASRTFTGAMFMSWDYGEAFIGRGTSGGVCTNQSVGARWTNAPGDGTWFQTEFFYEAIGGQTRFGIYDKFGAKRQITLGGGSCNAAATESAYYQFDHSDGLPNPVSSLDYAYVRKYANPDPLITNRNALSALQCLANGQGPCTTSNQSATCASGACSGNALVCIPPVSNSCAVDADCSSNRYCHRTTYSCELKLDNGDPLPADGVHDSCSTGDTNAACSSGRCNSAALTCAGEISAACSTGSECIVGACDPDGYCGYASGGSCTQQTQAVCRSSTCGNTGVCIPANGCDEDALCSSQQHCNTTTYSCAADLASGAAIPAGHGICGGAAGSAGASVDACASGFCNAQTDTCATQNGTSCGTGAQCVSNICDSDGKCGYADGAGSCTALTASRVCRSGVCSEHGGTCIPNATGACWIDADCAGTEFCHRGTLTCTARLADGSALPTDNLHDSCDANINAACASGLCNPTTLTCALANQSACTSAAECVSNTCDSDGKCGYADGHGSCANGASAPQCRSGMCGTTSVCIPAGGCAHDSDCDPEEHCVAATLACAADLANGFPIPDGHGDCTASGDVGSAQSACSSGSCNPITGSCAGQNSNTSCTSASECVSNVCGSNGQCGLSAGDSGCTEGSAGDTCQSGVCSPSTGTCIPSGSDRCYADADCGPTQYCHRSTFLCHAKLAAGAELPADSLHANCPATEVNAACESGLCNRDSGTCALGLSGACDDARQCVSNVCDQDGVCGYADGSGPCSEATQADVCRSGICSPSGRCIPSGGCAHDSECDAEHYCSAATLACALDLANGSPIPARHGTCAESGDFGGASSACASGACNPATNTCAADSVTSCSAALECVSNVCAENGMCGYANGAGSSCAHGQPAEACQSGTCSAHEDVCVPAGPGKCWVDQDCEDGQYCHRSSFECRAALESGTALPNDALHETCASNHANQACASGRCDATLLTCVSANGASCSGSGDCGSGVCGANGKCGYAPGQGTCDGTTAELVCQSGRCTSSGVCSTTSDDGCWIDSDCGDGKYCDRAVLTCRAKLAPGALIPSDGLHDGCPENAETVACESGRCNPTTNTCAQSTGETCGGAAQCVNNICSANGQCGHADGEGPCSNSDAAAVCQSHKCSAHSGLCVSGACWSDTDCTESEFCSRTTQKCETKLGSGSSLPHDGLHDTCGSDGKSAACTTGMCDAAALSCVSANGASCTEAAACASHACGGNGKCGYAPGEGKCTKSDERAVCQSGHCTPSGVCAAQSEDGCWQDSDCGEEAYCDRQALTCRTKQGSGGALPNDGLHDACGDDAINPSCMSGRCNPVTNTCAAANSSACSGAASCVSNICADNGKCGHADGEGPCTEADAASACQSGKCSKAGVCISGSCWQDTDCEVTQYCSRAAQTCKAKLSGGAALPSDDQVESCTSGTCSACSSGLAENGVCVNDKGAFNVSGGGGCNAAGGAGRGAAGSFLWVLGLVWLVGRNRRRLVPGRRRGELRDQA